MKKSLFLLLLAASNAFPAAAPIPAPPTVPTTGYILIDQDSGRVLAAQRSDDRMEPASITKLMTGYIVYRALKEKRLRHEDPVTISEHAWRSEGSRTFADVGTQIPVDT
ncbi:MAG TPA: serine hydrolase, partial [Steroidobacteraceae bacterium]|nr:serine hydrolase [Steroidobacteraceae bacterium]